MDPLIRVVARSKTGDRAAFSEKFASAQERLRLEPYRAGLLPAGLWRGFLEMPFPFPAEFWVAERDGQIVGRVGANVSMSRPKTGYVGFFEVDVNRPGSRDTALALLSAALDWLREKGAEDVYGPLNINTWFQYRFRVREKEDLRFSWEPVNPPEYPEFFRGAGFNEHENYHSEGLEGLAGVAEKTKEAHGRALKSGYRFRKFDGENLLDREVPILYEISMKGFKDNFLFEPITFEAFRQLYVPVANKIDISSARFVLNPEGREIGFFFVFLDGEYAVLKSVAMLPEARGLGLSNGMTHEAANEALGKGVTKLITALVRSGAQSESYAKKATSLWKHEYSLFRKNLK